MSNPLLDRYPHLGKYEGELNLAAALDEMGGDEDLGDVETFGYYQLFPDLDDGQYGDLGGIVAAILFTRSDGFVSATYFEVAGDAVQAWEKLEREYSSFVGDED